jgi:putative addiction module component (TIGR02574 family)
MNAETEAIFNAALSLPPDNRASLAEKLLDSLGEKEQEEIDAAWAKEAEDRLKDFEEGKIKGVPFQEVMRSVRKGKKV